LAFTRKSWLNSQKNLAFYWLLLVFTQKSWARAISEFREFPKIKNRAPFFTLLQTTQKLSDVTDDVIITFLMHFWIDLSVPDIFDKSLVTQFLIMTEIWLIVDFKISSPHHRHPEFFVTMEFVSDFSKSD
jgi:hypothetical protein